MPGNILVQLFIQQPSHISEVHNIGHKWISLALLIRYSCLLSDQRDVWIGEGHTCAQTTFGNKACTSCLNWQQQTENYRLQSLLEQWGGCNDTKTTCRPADFWGDFERDITAEEGIGTDPDGYDKQMNKLLTVLREGLKGVKLTKSNSRFAMERMARASPHEDKMEGRQVFNQYITKEKSATLGTQGWSRLVGRMCAGAGNHEGRGVQ